MDLRTQSQKRDLYPASCQVKMARKKNERCPVVLGHGSVVVTGRYPGPLLSPQAASKSLSENNERERERDSFNRKASMPLLGPQETARCPR